MKALNAFVKQENAWATLIGKKPLSLSDAQDRQRIARIIDSRLSPENLSCDGELSRAETNRRYRELANAAEQLLKLDPTVKFYEYA